LYTSPNIIRRMIWVGHVACLDYEKCIQNCGQRSQKGRDHPEDLGIDERLIFE
jgi:hypothetical protein